MKNLVGRTIDNYRLDALQGEGGMGAVFRGWDLTLQRDVAIKIMHPHIARESAFRDRFLQEARAAARLDHPGVVRVFGFNPDPERLYIVMEFIPGDNLQDMLGGLRRNRQWIPLNEAVDLICELGRTLHYMHDGKVLHRDIKPANIMLKPDSSRTPPYRPVVTDLGLAQLAEGGLRTSAGSSMGTPAYMSPEQAVGQRTDRRSDVYSLGVLLYELATGHLPFSVRTITEAIHAHTRLAPPAPRSLAPNLPERVEAVILRAMEKEPAARFSGTAEMVDALVQVPAATLFSIPPPVDGGAVSLFTQFRRSLVDRSMISLGDFADTISPVAGSAKLQVMAPDGGSRTLTLKTPMTVGRSTNCELVLDDPQVSRQHLRIEQTSGTYYVTDLQSANGTFLQKQRLPSNSAQPWGEDQPLRVGHHWLRLIFSEEGGPLSPETMQGTGFTQRQGLALYLNAPELSVRPGDSVNVPAQIVNDGEQAEQVVFHVEGIPAAWVRVPARVELRPNERKSVGLVISVPRTSASRADRYPLTIRGASATNPSDARTVRTVLTVAPFHAAAMHLEPARLRAGEEGQVRLRNDGNVTESVTLRWYDQGNELTFEAAQSQIGLAAGAEANVTFRALPRKRPLVGGVKTHVIDVRMEVMGREVQRVSGQVISRAVLPIWLLLIIVVLLGGGAAFGVYSQSGVWQQNAAATAAAQTSTAVARATVHQRETATAGAQIALATREQEAALSTATADAIAVANADSDSDGLTDSDEARWGTDPNRADTDGDGLDDKDELNLGTNPLKADTDGDGLSDGKEIALRTDPRSIDSDGDNLSDGEEVNRLNSNPINRDTDGDGLLDDVDPSPLTPPTATPTPNATATARVVHATLTRAAQLRATSAAATTTAIAGAAATSTAAARVAATATAIARLTAAAPPPTFTPQPPTPTFTTAPPSLPPSGENANRLLAESLSSPVTTQYRTQAERLANSLAAHVVDFPNSGSPNTWDMQNALQRSDVGARINGLTQAAWSDWVGLAGRAGIDPNTASPANRGLSPMRVLAVQLMQGRTSPLNDTERRGLHNFFSRSEDPGVWTSNVSGVIHAVNVESFSQ